MANDVITEIQASLDAIWVQRQRITASLASKGLTVNSASTFQEIADAIVNMSFMPYTGNTPAPAGSFSKAVPSWVNDPQNYTMYYNGDFKASRVMNAVYNDYAEFFEADDLCWEYGDIIELNPETKCYRKSQSANSTLVVGVASDTFGSIVGGKEGTIDENIGEFIPVGLMGRVGVKTKGAVQIGDLICSSDEPGIGCACDEPKVGTVIGKALAASTKDYDVVPVLIMRG